MSNLTNQNTNRVHLISYAKLAVITSRKENHAKNDKDITHHHVISGLGIARLRNNGTVKNYGTGTVPYITLGTVIRYGRSNKECQEALFMIIKQYFTLRYVSTNGSDFREG